MPYDVGGGLDTLEQLLRRPHEQGGLPVINAFAPAAEGRAALGPRPGGGFESLAQSGPDAMEESIRNYLREAPPEAVAENPRAAWQTALEVLDLPRNAVANLVGNAFGVTPASKETFAGMRKVYASDFLDQAGWKPDSLAGKAAHFLTGLTLDFASDPITWLTLGGAGTVSATSRLLGAGGKAAGTAAELSRAAKTAAELGKGMTFGRAVDAAGNVVRDATHVKPEALSGLEALTQAVETNRAARATIPAAGEMFPGIRETTPALSAVEEALGHLGPEDVYAGRYGVGIGTHAARTTPLGHIITGPALLAGKLAGKGLEYGGQVAESLLSKIPGVGGVVGPAIGGPVELAGKALQVPINLAGKLSDVVGTPGRFLPAAEHFVPFREIPGVSSALDSIEQTLARSPTAQAIGDVAGKAGAAIKSGLQAIGVGAPTKLALLAREFLEQAKGANRADEASLYRELDPLIRDAAQETGIDDAHMRPLLATLAEHAGMVRSAAEAGDPDAVSRSVGEMRQAVSDLLGLHYPQADVVKQADAVMEALKVPDRTPDPSGAWSGSRDLLGRPILENKPGLPPADADTVAALRAQVAAGPPAEELTTSGGAKRPGMRKLIEKFAGIHDELVSQGLIEDVGQRENAVVNEGANAEALYLPGYTFAHQDRGEAELVRGLLPKELRRNVKVLRPGASAQGAQTGADIAAAMREAGVEDTTQAMADSIVRYAGQDRTIDKARAAMDYLKQDQSGVVDSIDPTARHSAAVLEKYFGDVPELWHAARGQRPEMIPARQVNVGDPFTVAGEHFKVTGKTADAVIVKDGIEHVEPIGGYLVIDKGSLGSAPAVAPVFRETSLDEAESYLPNSSSRGPTEPFGRPLHFATSPDLALGQGENRGVLLEMDPSGLKLGPNTGKPGLAMTEAAGQGSELIGTTLGTPELRGALRAVTVKPGATGTLGPKFERRLGELVQQGWQRLENPDGSITYRRPAVPTESIDPTHAAAQPLVGKLAEWIEAGATPTAKGLVDWAKKNVPAEERRAIFGVAKIGATENRPAAEALAKIALARTGRDIAGVKWENVYRRLEAIERIGRGEPARTGPQFAGTTPFEVQVPGTTAPTGLTPLGQQTLDAMHALLAHNDHPELAARLGGEVEQLQRKMEWHAQQGRPFPQSERSRLAVKKTVLARLSATPAQDPAAIAAEAAAAGPPPPPGEVEKFALRTPTPRDLFAEPIADVMERMLALEHRTRREESAKGVGTADIGKTTARGIGYFPHYIGEGNTFVGKVTRQGGMAWEQELRAALPDNAPSSAKEPYQFLIDLLQRENVGRAQRGLPALEIPARDAPLPEAIAGILRDNPDLTPSHRSQLMRQFGRESTIQELNQIAEHTGVSFDSDPVRVWLKRRVASNYAQAGADFLRAAIQQGVDGGWVKRVAATGPTPEGYSRITDARFGDLSKGYAFNEDLVREFKRFQRISSAPGPVLRAWDWATAKWKNLVLSVMPHTTSNLLQGIFQSNQFNAFTYKSWDAAQRLMEDYHGAKNLERPIGDYLEGLPDAVKGQSVRAFWDALSIEHGALGKGLHGVELEHAAGAGMKDGWSAAAAAKSAFDNLSSKQGAAKVGAAVIDAGRAYFRAFRAANVAVEDWMKTGFILERLRQGDDLAAAAGKARVALNQGADLTDVDKAIFKRLLPWWGWMKGNALLQYGMAVARPQVTALVPKIRGNLEASFAGDETLPLSLRPQHISGELGAQLSGGSKPDFLNLNRVLPVKELGLTPAAGLAAPRAAGEQLLENLHPFLKMPLESILNRDTNFDRPINEYEGQRKTFLGVPLSPEQKRVAKLVRPLNILEQQTWRGAPADLSEAGAAGAQALGVRTFPVDVARQVYQRERDINEQLGAVMRDYARARQTAEGAGRDWKTDQETQRLAEIYRGLVATREQLPLKPLRDANRQALSRQRDERKELRQFALGG